MFLPLTISFVSPFPTRLRPTLESNWLFRFMRYYLWNTGETKPVSFPFYEILKNFLISRFAFFVTSSC